MTDEDILTGIRGVVSEHLDFEGDIQLDTPVAEALELDSIRLLTLVVEIENHFAICLDDEEQTIETVEDLVMLVRRSLG